MFIGINGISYLIEINEAILRKVLNDKYSCKIKSP